MTIEKTKIHLKHLRFIQAHDKIFDHSDLMSGSLIKTPNSQVQIAYKYNLLLQQNRDILFNASFHPGSFFPTFYVSSILRLYKNILLVMPAKRNRYT